MGRPGVGPGKYLYIRVFHTATLPTRGRRGSQTPAFLEETGAAVDGSPRWCFVLPPASCALSDPRISRSDFGEEKLVSAIPFCRSRSRRRLLSRAA